jgi:hypothetical protein
MSCRKQVKQEKSTIMKTGNLNLTINKLKIKPIKAATLDAKNSSCSDF